MEVGHATGSRQGQSDHDSWSDSLAVQVVKQRAILMVVCDQPQLGPGSIV